MFRRIPATDLLVVLCAHRGAYHRRAPRSGNYAGSSPQYRTQPRLPGQPVADADAELGTRPRERRRFPERIWGREVHSKADPKVVRLRLPPWALGEGWAVQYDGEGHLLSS